MEKRILNDFFEKFKEVPNEQKKRIWSKNQYLKQAVNTKLEELKEATSSQIISKRRPYETCFSVGIGFSSSY